MDRQGVPERACMYNTRHKIDSCASLTKKQSKLFFPLQEACFQYWPSRLSEQFGEFVIELVGEEEQTGYKVRKLNIHKDRVSCY